MGAVGQRLGQIRPRPASAKIGADANSHRAVDRCASTRGSRWEARTRARYAELFRLHVEPHLGRAKASAVTARDVRLWVQTLTAGGLAAATVAQCVSVLSAVLIDAIEVGIRSDNPCAGARPRAAAPEARKTLTAAEVTALLGESPWPDRVVYLLAVTTGCASASWLV